MTALEKHEKQPFIQVQALFNERLWGSEDPDEHPIDGESRPVIHGERRAERYKVKHRATRGVPIESQAYGRSAVLECSLVVGKLPAADFTPRWLTERGFFSPPSAPGLHPDQGAFHLRFVPRCLIRAAATEPIVDFALAHGRQFAGKTRALVRDVPNSFLPKSFPAVFSLSSFLGGERASGRMLY